jgi:peptidoglycan/xylan/chitin deacetylase (PgdA/CDA1 family)
MREDFAWGLPLVRARARRVGAELYYGGLRTLRITARRRSRPDAGVILCYHNVVTGDDDSLGAPGLHVRLDRFERQVRWLADHYAVVSLRDWVQQRSPQTSLPLAAITFDDGYAGVFEHAVPFLRRLGIAATVFIVGDAPGQPTRFWWDHPDVIRMLTPDLRDRWLRDLRGDRDAILSEARASRVEALSTADRAADWATICKHAGAGIDIGVHSATHRSLTTLSDAELAHEVVASRTLIHERTGIRPELFAYPYGIFDARVEAAVRDAGYVAAFALDRENDASANRWSLPRIPVPAAISDRAFEAWACGLHR